MREKPGKLKELPSMLKPSVKKEREAGRTAKEAVAQREREAREAERVNREAKEAEVQREREVREAEAKLREKPGTPRDQPNMKENMKNMNYKREWCVYEENRT